ncbi:MAG: PD40 domain-containing protein [Bacteroidales bacterium]|nr:PD40 domain-containing protein [Bacteroidales bacterium]
MKGNSITRMNIFLNILAFLSFTPVIAQTQSELKDIFLEAESFFLFEEYKDALPLYQKILMADPDNHHITYKIGICYLKDPYQKEKSIRFLEKATENTTANYNENSFREKQAPPEAFYYLGDAYRVNNRLDDAIRTYRRFKEILDPEIYDSELVDKQIQSCRIALRLEANPNYIIKENLGEEINSRFAEINPLVSGDESTLVFTKKLQFYDAVFYSRKENGRWSYPVNLTPSFELDGNSYCTGLSWDGTELFVYRSDGFDGNLYYSSRTDDKWAKLDKLNDNINTKYWESHASLSPDGKTLYFTSNRKGGYGGLDIYQSKRSGKTDWGIPVNLGPVVNSKYNEDTPFITGDGKTLYFSSLGHYNMGGYDIFYTTLLSDNQWAKPLNAGYPVNSTDDDLFFVPVKNGEYAYYSIFDSKQGYGLDDIYRFEIFSDLHPRKFILKGLATKDADLDISYENIMAKLIDKKTNKTFSETKVNPDGTYNLDAQSGSFELVIDGKGIDESRVALEIPVAHPSDVFEFKSELTASEVTAAADYQKTEPAKQIPNLEIEKEYYHVINDEQIAIRLNLEKNTLLELEIFNNDSLLKKEQFNINRKRFIYFYKPLAGLNLLQFTLHDKDGNMVTKSVSVEYITEQQPLTAEQIPEETAKTKEELKNLSNISSGNLKEYLEKLDFEKNNINSASGLYEYLVREMPGNTYSLAEIDELFISYLSQKPLDAFVNELGYASTDKIKEFLSYTNLDSANIVFPENLVDFLGTDIEKKPFTIDDLDYSLTNIASKNTGSIKDFLDILNANSNQNMSFALRRLESNIGSFSEPFQITKYLRSNVGEDKYNGGDIQDMMKESSVNYDINFLHQSMLFAAKGNLRQTLADLNLSEKNIRTSRELLQHLWINAPDYGYNVSEVIDLIDHIKTNSDRNLEIFRQQLAKHASGNLKAVIQSLNLKQKNISTFADLLNYLINNSKFQDYNRETVYKLLLDIIYINNMDEFVKLLKKHGCPEIIQAIESIDLHRFSTPYELIQYLVGYTDKYAYTEQDILNLLLKLVLEKGFDLDKDKAEVPTPDKLKQRKLLIPLLIANGILILIIILFFLRRKKKKSTGT